MFPAPKPGDRVRVTEGTFHGFIGIVREHGTVERPVVPDNQFDVLVEISIFGRMTPVFIDPVSLELA
jgi:transcription antitermination factor NusG